MVYKISTMRKKFTTSRFSTLLTALTLLVSATSFVLGDDHFNLSIGNRDSLVISGAKGEHIAELPIPSISAPVTVGGTTFQVSYGRDANNLLTAILAPNPSQAQDLHFNVANKSVDSDKQAVVTLTFNSSDRVTVDPGYIGLVQVNSHAVKHRDVAGMNRYAPAPSMPAPTSAPAPTSDAPAPSMDLSSTPNYETAPSSVAYTPPAPVQKREPLFWAEPVTPPNGVAPQESSSEMKLVEIQGTVTVKTENGVTKDGEEGMIIPSGSTVSTPAGSSVAVFMNGVNSARLLPDSEVKITEHLNGSTRNTMIDLKQGTVFSRVGRRPGETQDYEVRTPEGVAAARGTEFADYRANGRHFVFVAKGVVDELDANGNVIATLNGINGEVGKGSMPPSAGDLDQVFQQIMEALQPFNLKLKGVIDRINGGTASDRDIAFYNILKNTFFEDFGPIFPYDPDHPNDFLLPITSNYGYEDAVHSPVLGPQDYQDPDLLDLVLRARRAVDQDLVPFGTNPLTPY